MVKLPLALGTPHKWFTWLDVITCFSGKLKVKSNLIRVTTEFPYVGKLIASRMPRLCQVSQKWPVIFVWLQLMLDYINYYFPTQQGSWTCSASQIRCEAIKKWKKIRNRVLIHSCFYLWAASALCSGPENMFNWYWHCGLLGMHPPGPPLARPVLPRERGALDRVIEYLVGNGPQNR